MEGQLLPARAVVIAMGPWSGDAAAWFPGLPRIGGQKAHSILVRPARPVGADCLFAQLVTSSGGAASHIQGFRLLGLGYRGYVIGLPGLPDIGGQKACTQHPCAPGAADGGRSPLRPARHFFGWGVNIQGWMGGCTQ